MRRIKKADPMSVWSQLSHWLLHTVGCITYVYNTVNDLEKFGRIIFTSPTFRNFYIFSVSINVLGKILAQQFQIFMRGVCFLVRGTSVIRARPRSRAA